MAVDAQGGIHVAYAIRVGVDNDQRPAYYAHCAADCTNPQQWTRGISAFQAPALLVLALIVSMFAAAASPVHAQGGDQETILPAPPRAEGDGPFDRLILRGAILVEGTGAPPVGPVDVVIEGNRIAEVKTVGFPGVPIDESERPAAREGDRVMDLAGFYLLPGFVDLHAHFGGDEQGVPAEYPAPKLQMRPTSPASRSAWCLWKAIIEPALDVLP